jgi:hypothetical protein
MGRAWLAAVAGWSALLKDDPRLRLEHHFVTNEIAVNRDYFKPVQAFVYRRVG